MAAPVYVTDLTSITTAESTTNFTGIGGGGALTLENDFYIQGSNCISKATAASWDTAGTPRGGAIYNNGSGITIPTDGAVLMWIYWWGPGVLATKANGGAELNIGSATTAYKSWYVTGSDDWQFGGWRCYPVNPTVATSRANTGSPTATLQYFGWQANLAVANSIARGNPYGLDAIRYGRCMMKCYGGSDIEGYVTFDGIANTDANSANRYGLCIFRDGAYYLQGLLKLGEPDALPDPIGCEFVDANKTIFIPNTERVTAGFNRIEIVVSSSYISWTNMTFTALGTVSRGDLQVSNNPTILMDSCTFTDMGTFGFNSAATLTSTTFRRCNLITTGGGTFTDCTFDRTNDATRAVTVASPAQAGLISNSTFISSGTKHGLEITGTAANVTLTNLTWSGYASADGSTGNEAIYVNIATGSMNITVSGGTVPSIRTAGCAVTVIAGAVNVNVKVIKEDTTALQDALVLVIANSGGPLPYNATVTITRSGNTATVSHTAHGMATNDKVQIKGANQLDYNGIFTITKIDANSYSYTVANSPTTPATGTIKATYTAIYDTTDVNGNVPTLSRVFPSDQPIIGKVRKSTTPPYYKTGSIVGIVSSSTGYSTTVQLILDQ